MDESVVVSPDWLASRLDDPTVRVVDVRDAWEYDGIGHLPGAVTVPFDSYRDESDVDRGTLPGADAFADLLGQAGIDEGDTIVAYDDTHGVFAARFVLTAIEYGHEDVRLLDGDYSAWNREHETTSDEPDVEPTEYEADPLDPNESPLVDREAVEDALERNAVFVDTREKDEFEEARLPGAVRFDWREVVDDETRRLKPEDDLEALLEEHGITRDREIVLYCNTARRISHTYVVLTALGYENVRFYEGSLTDWLAADGEIETGPVASE
ncbi:sulfurtransferase [Natrinema salifodinae]|uniref:Thiosulfate/3-mercaptopyruvate sulfurtransferase n=1 Tax=Natrinema salifodinae TaxID=1202768 RepID=A0A1I0QBC4_9EURY|nr:sulfurtransferase [Natrinema salifodinae]SEW24344.1 thiosulfate/3-mercaptopyruvate sulfurtransferase [Natrinema salifodinae]